MQRNSIAASVFRKGRVHLSSSSLTRTASLRIVRVRFQENSDFGNMSTKEDPPSRQQRMSFAQMFPLGFSESAKQWWSATDAKTAELKLLKMIPHLVDGSTLKSLTPPEGHSDPFGFRTWHLNKVPLAGKNRILNEFSIDRVGEPVDENLVMLHGYGAGLGLYYQNFEPLSRVTGWKIWALDMLGMGNSSRPPFTIKAKTRAAAVTEAEAWFIDSLEEWREKRRLDTFTLCAHSMGGYLGVAYALKYPGRIKKLILASPVGVPENPNAVDDALPEPGESTLESEFTKSQEDLTKMTPSSGVPKAEPARKIPGWVKHLWDANVSPFSLIRYAGPLGPRLVSGWSSRRFNHLPAEEAAIMHDYAFSIFRQPGSGEYALPYLLAPGAYARRPIINRIDRVGRGVLPAPEGSSAEGVPVKETGIPVVFMYGDGDWMDVAGGYAAVEKLAKRREKALMEGTERELREENGAAKVVIIGQAGHNLFLDNPAEFNEVMKLEMEAV